METHVLGAMEESLAATSANPESEMIQTKLEGVSASSVRTHSNKPLDFDTLIHTTLGTGTPVGANVDPPLTSAQPRDESNSSPEDEWEFDDDTGRKHPCTAGCKAGSETTAAPTTATTTPVANNAESALCLQTRVTKTVTTASTEKETIA